MQPLRTIGYQEAAAGTTIECLNDAGIELLVDVRAVAASRRPGFSKRQLAAGLAAAGIDYLHLQKLGTPKAGREAVRGGRPEEMRRIYAAHLETPEAQTELATLAEIVRSDRSVCLLCFERDPRHCHRTILAERLEDALGVTVVHLFPPAPDDSPIPRGARAADGPLAP
jgi:uncharacterized protein (DUF488 family)